VRVGSVHIDLGRIFPPRGHREPVRYWVPGHYETRTTKIWVPGYYREEWVPPVYETVETYRGPVRVLVRPGHHERVWVPGCYETRTERVWVPGHYAYRR
jgi:hypothetical protein